MCYFVRFSVGGARLFVSFYSSATSRPCRLWSPQQGAAAAVAAVAAGGSRRPAWSPSTRGEGRGASAEKGHAHTQGESEQVQHISEHALRTLRYSQSVLDQVVLPYICSCITLGI